RRRRRPHRLPSRARRIRSGDARGSRSRRSGRAPTADVGVSSSRPPTDQLALERVHRCVLGDQALEQGLELVSGAHRQRADEAAALAVAGEERSGGQRSFRRQRVEAADVAEDLDGRAEDLAEEGGNGVVTRAAAGENLAGLGPLVVRVRPVLDPLLAAVERVEEVGDVAGGEDAWSLGLEALVDEDAVVERETAVCEEVDIRYDTDADHGELGFDAEAALGLPIAQPALAIAAEAGHLLLEQQLDTVLAIESGKLVAPLRRAELIEQSVTAADQGDGQV